MSVIKNIVKKFKKKQPIYKTSTEIILSNIINEKNIIENKNFISNMQNTIWGKDTPKSILCFMLFSPDSVMAGGMSTILNLCYNLSKIWDAKVYLCFFPAISNSNNQINIFKKNVKNYIPDFEYEIIEYSDDITMEVDIAISTFWLTAYPLLRYNKCKEKYYLVQDFENTFYQSGPEYTLAELTYKFGFNKLVNSCALKRNMEFIDDSAPVYRYLPGINRQLYYPEINKQYNKDVITIVVYGRPWVPRNGFFTLIPVFKALKEKYKDKIRIITVGDNFKPKHFGLSDIIENKGKLNSLEELAKLYRTADIGISLITTPTFSYQHLEFMASGLCLVTNKQAGIEDFLRDGENAVVCEPIPNIITEKISELIESPQLREKISKAGYEYTQKLDWDNCFKGIANFITNDNKYQGEKNAI